MQLSRRAEDKVDPVIRARVKLYGRIGRCLSRLGLGIIPGARRLYVRLYNRFVEPKGDVYFSVKGNKICLSGASVLGAELVTDGGHEELQTEIFERMLRPGMIVVDVGASIGYHSLIAARLVGSTGAVYAFEPEPRSYELLCKNIALNGYRNIVAVKEAVSNASGKVGFYCGIVWPDRSSLARDNVLGASKEARFMEVEAVSLDAFLPRSLAMTG